MRAAALYLNPYPASLKEGKDRRRGLEKKRSLSKPLSSPINWGGGEGGGEEEEKRGVKPKEPIP